MRWQLKQGCIQTITVVTLTILGAGHGLAQSFDHRFAERAHLAEKYLFENISPSGAATGAVVASPSRANPDYFFHWVRDAGLVMNTVLDLYERTSSSQKRSLLRQKLFHFVAFSRRNQETATLSGLGEPKFHADGRSFTDPWGRPQNDGPALRAITMIRFANLLLKEGSYKDVVPNLYKSELPANSLIKRDLEFVAYHWKDHSFDIWEEVLGQHFYTLLVQRRSLLDGAALAQRLGDTAAADYYRSQANLIARRLDEHRDYKGGILVTTRHRSGGLDYKSSQLDSQVILGILHARGSDGFLSPADDLALSTFHRLEQTFERLYPINRQGQRGVAIGRYPEDRYDGYTTSSSGNPWFIGTLGFAEYLYELKRELQTRREVVVNQLNRKFFESLGVRADKQMKLEYGSPAFHALLTKLDQRANDYADRAMFHSDVTGRMSEQLNLYSGYMQGSHDLTWSYASFLTAFMAKH